MFRLIIFACFLHFSVGAIIHGRIVIDENPNRPTTIPIGCLLIVQLQDTSIAGSISSVLKQAEFSGFVSLPAFYEIEIPTAISPAGSYSLTAQITKNNEVLYSTEKPLPVQIDPHSSLETNILVLDLKQDEATRQWLKRRRELSWPEMLGKKGGDAVKYIKEKTGLTNVYVVPDGARLEPDYREDRVRVIVETYGHVIAVPRAG